MVLHLSVRLHPPRSSENQDGAGPKNGSSQTTGWLDLDGWRTSDVSLVCCHHSTSHVCVCCSRASVEQLISFLFKQSEMNGFLHRALQLFCTWCVIFVVQVEQGHLFPRWRTVGISCRVMERCNVRRSSTTETLSCTVPGPGGPPPHIASWDNPWLELLRRLHTLFTPWGPVSDMLNGQGTPPPPSWPRTAGVCTSDDNTPCCSEWRQTHGSRKFSEIQSEVLFFRKGSQHWNVELTHFVQQANWHS